MIFAGEKWNVGLVRFRTLLPVLLVMGSILSPVAAQAEAMVPAEKICMPKGTYSMIGGGTTVFSRDKTCFSRPVTSTFPWEKKIPLGKKSPPDPFNGARVVRYDYHDALYHCVKRDMRLPTVEELSALFAYANTSNGTATGGQYAIVARSNDSHYPGGLHGWGGGTTYWSHTFAGKSRHKVVDLGNGQVSVDHDPSKHYVSCVR
jgi:hypothetical protein